MIRNLARVLAAGALLGGLLFGAMLIAAIHWTWAALAYGTLAGATVFVIVFAWTWLRTGIEIDRAIEDLPATLRVVRYVCDLELCDLPSAVEFDAGNLDGRLYICAQHAAQVSEWAPVVGVRMPFDQEAS